MRLRHLSLAIALMLLPSGSAVALTAQPCPPTPGVPANQDVLDGRCLVQTDPGGAFAGTGEPRTFKVPSPIFLGADRPPTHSGSLDTLEQIARF